MPELPDITVYVERLNAMAVGQTIAGIRIANPFVLRTVTPATGSFHGKRFARFERLGKRIVMVLDDLSVLVLHLMVAGRLCWKKPGASLGRREGLAAIDLDCASIVVMEHGSTRRASMHALAHVDEAAAFDRGGLDVFAVDAGKFTERLRSENHTLKRALTDPHLFDGIGNSYSDEILFRARLSPVRLSQQLAEAESTRLFTACRNVLAEWTSRLREEAGEGWPSKVTAFREEMAVHGRFGKPCPVCATPVQRIRYAENETNYCPQCQTNGVLLADRALSRLLKGDWPRTVAELEERRSQPTVSATARRV